MWKEAEDVWFFYILVQKSSLIIIIGKLVDSFLVLKPFCLNIKRLLPGEEGMDWSRILTLEPHCWEDLPLSKEISGHPELYQDQESLFNNYMQVILQRTPVVKTWQRVLEVWKVK